MKTSISNGINVSNLNWDYFITIVKFKPTSIAKWNEEMDKIIKRNHFTQIYWSCEKTKFMNGTYHSHLLVDTSTASCKDQDLVSYFSNYLVKGKEISYKSTYTTTTPKNAVKEIDGKKIVFDTKTGQNQRLIEYKTSQNLIGANNQTIKRDIIEKGFIPFYEIQGQEGRCYIERIKGVRNASIYMNKFTDRGINTGYLNNI